MIIRVLLLLLLTVTPAPAFLKHGGAGVGGGGAYTYVCSLMTCNLCVFTNAFSGVWCIDGLHPDERIGEHHAGNWFR